MVKPQSLKRLMLPGVALALVLAALAWQQWGPMPESVAAQVNGDVIPTATLEVFVSAARRAEPDTSRESVLRGLVENRLLADLAREQPGHDHDGQGRVGYDADTLLEQQRFRLIRTAYASELRAAMQRSGKQDSLAFLTAPLQLSAQTLAPMLNLEQTLYSTMTAAQQQAARDHILARYRFAADQPEQTLTLWELYRRQNIQLKVQMHNLNTDFIREAIRQQLTVAYVADWFQRSSGLSAEAVAAVDRCIEDAQLREALLHDMGLLHDIHDDNPQLRALADQVSEQDIEDYYWQHKQAFSRVERVHAYHLRLDSQQQADKVYQQIRDGLPFAQAVSRYSMADDRGRGGELGWIDRHSREDHWTRALAFVQPENQVSPPFRSPAAAGKPHWEILWVDQRETGYQPLESESVRYRASREVAKQRLQQRFHTLLAETTEQASLRINAEVL